MNREHLKAFFWLWWRLRVNGLKKAGQLNAVLVAILAGLGAVTSVTLFFCGFVAGLLALPRAAPVVRLYVWDGLVLAFLFFWLMRVLTGLQRSDGLSMDKFLHLPVSPAGAFFLNYLGSLLSLTLLIFIPATTGLLLGQVFAHGPGVLLGFPLVAAFLLAVTSLTYQFQGWLATLMANPRRRRTIIVLVTGGIVLLAQTPGLVNVARPHTGRDDAARVRDERLAELSKRLANRMMTGPDYQTRSKAITDEYHATKAELSRQMLANLERRSWLLNTALPPGWLPLGLAGLPQGQYLPALLGTLAFGLIGAASLWRAYKTTVRLFAGEFTARGQKVRAKAVRSLQSAKLRFLERRLPWISEQASAVAVAAFRGLVRAPEAKMAVLTPVLIALVIGGYFLSTTEPPPPEFRPLTVFGATVFLLITSVHLTGNQFGYDRSGFRAFVLSAVPRREILLGKNLAVAPLVVGLGVFALLVVGIAFPMRVDDYLAVLAQIFSTYLLFSLLTNALSILAPIPIKSGSMQPAQVRVAPFLMHLAFAVAFPAALTPLFLPHGIQMLVEERAGIEGLPISLALSLALLAGMVLLYRRVLTWQGEWLLSREQEILETVTTNVE